MFNSSASAFGQYFGSEASLRRIVAPLTRVPGASTQSGTAKLMPLQKRWAGCGEGEAIAQCRNSPRTTFDASSVYIAKSLGSSGHAAFVRAADAGATLICDAYGGAISDVSPTATAFAHRNVRFSVQIASFTSLGTAKAIVRRARGLIAPFGNGGRLPELRRPRAAQPPEGVLRAEPAAAAADQAAGRPGRPLPHGAGDQLNARRQRSVPVAPTPSTASTAPR